MLNALQAERVVWLYNVLNSVTENMQHIYENFMMHAMSKIKVAQKEKRCQTITEGVITHT